MRASVSHRNGSYDSKVLRCSACSQAWRAVNAQLAEKLFKQSSAIYCWINGSDVRVSEKKTGTACEKCGSENASGTKYCPNCGWKIAVPKETGFGRFEGLCLLHLTGSVYLLLSVLFNWTVPRSIYYSLVGSELLANLLFLVPYLVGGVLGLVASYAFYSWWQVKRRKLVIVTAATAIAVGFSATFSLFYFATYSLRYIGLDLSGTIGPAWVIFLANGWKLWTDKNKLKTSP